jgi:hypothetical protein
MNAMINPTTAAPPVAKAQYSISHSFPIGATTGKPVMDDILKRPKPPITSLPYQPLKIRNGEIIIWDTQNFKGFLEGR